jgi:hypothetical protein
MCAVMLFFSLRSSSHGQFVPRSMSGARSTSPVVVPNNLITVRTASCLVRVAALPPIAAAAEAPPTPRPARAPGPSSDPTWPRPDAQRTAPRQRNRRASTPYFLGTQNTAECTNGNDIGSEAQCKEAAAVLGKTYKNSGSWSNWPNACYYSTAFFGTGVYFNTYGSGATAQSAGTPICASTPSPTPSPTTALPTPSPTGALHPDTSAFI